MCDSEESAMGWQYRGFEGEVSLVKAQNITIRLGWLGGGAPWGLRGPLAEAGSSHIVTVSSSISIPV